MMGDDPIADIGGAFAIGISSAWLQHGRQRSRSDYLPTLEAQSFPEAVGRVLDRST